MTLDKEYLKKMLNQYADVAMEVNAITFKKSTLTPSGPIYEDLIEFRL